MGEPDVPPEVLEYLSAHQVMTLATASPAGIPHASTFLYVNEGPALYFWARAGTATSNQIEQNPVVAFAIDEYASDLSQTKGVQGTGECAVILSGLEVARVASLFGDKFPDLSPGMTMSISFFRVRPSELELIDNTRAGGSGDGEFGADFHHEHAYSADGGLPGDTGDGGGGELLTHRAEPGEVVVRAGGPADKFFVVVEGEVEVVREGEGDQAVETVGPGHVIGESAIMRGAARSATMRATKPTTLMSLDRQAFRTLVAQSLGTTDRFDS
jgi:uncharacterized protein YhbP (UPF0306 family)